MANRRYKVTRSVRITYTWYLEAISKYEACGLAEDLGEVHADEVTNWYGASHATVNKTETSGKLDRMTKEVIDG